GKLKTYATSAQGQRRHLSGKRMLATNWPRRLTLAVALAGVFLVIGVRATLFAHTLPAALCAKSHPFGRSGSGSALAVGVSNDFVAHGNLSQVRCSLALSHIRSIYSWQQ